MHYNITNVGFYDAMSVQAVDFIMKQTEIATIFCEGALVKKIVQMKGKGLSTSLKNLVLFDEIDAELTKQASEQDLNLHSYDEIIKEGEKADPAEHPFRETQPEDVYIFSYTSGTTGDSKGVKLAHRNIIAATIGINEHIPTFGDDVIISYLPLPHSFEQALTCNTLLAGSAIGYYQGNPLKLTEDCAAL